MLRSFVVVAVDALGLCGIGGSGFGLGLGLQGKYIVPCWGYIKNDHVQVYWVLSIQKCKIVANKDSDKLRLRWLRFRLEGVGWRITPFQLSPPATTLPRAPILASFLGGWGGGCSTHGNITHTVADEAASQR